MFDTPFFRPSFAQPYCLSMPRAKEVRRKGEGETKNNTKGEAPSSGSHPQQGRKINVKLTSNYMVINVERKDKKKHIIAVNCPYNYSLIPSSPH